MKFTILIISILFFACGKNKEEAPASQYENLLATVAYKKNDAIESNLLSLDIYYNNSKEEKKPVVIWVHGGAWSSGDKSMQIENKVNLFRRLDYVFVSINYRLSPFPFEINNPNRIMYPVHNQDIADAIRWVYDNIGEYGGNSNKIALLGHSAGAHLVSLIGTNSSFLENVELNFSHIKGVAAIDTEAYDVIGKTQNNSSLYLNAFGANRNYNLEASPIYNIRNGVSYPNFFIAKRGDVERITIANNFIDKLMANGVSVSEIDGSTYDHQGINNAIGAPNEFLVSNALEFFLQSCFE